LEEIRPNCVQNQFLLPLPRYEKRLHVYHSSISSVEMQVFPSSNLKICPLIMVFEIADLVCPCREVVLTMNR